MPDKDDRKELVGAQWISFEQQTVKQRRNTVNRVINKEMFMDAMKELYDVVGNPLAYARKLKETSGKKIIGYMCTYAPEELITAAGAHPLRLFGSNKNILLADGHLQSYCCSLVRGVLEDALGGDLNFLDAMIFPHTCDSVQRLSDIWRLNVPTGFHLDVVLPVKLDTESARVYLIETLGRFRNDLEKELQVKIADEDLKKAITLYNDIRKGLSQVYALKNQNPQAISGKDIYTLVRASMIMDRPAYLKIIQNVIKELEQSSGPAKKVGGKRLVLSGGICSHPDIYSVIEEAGGVVVGDDLCTGSRYFTGAIDIKGDPLAAIARRYWERINCPAKHQTNTSRAQNLLQIVKDSKASGVIFMLLKFCDPHAFDYPYLFSALDAAGISHLLLEVEDQPLAHGQLQTRLEAFLETL
jgi:bzd-type benzoyl-CoA reductase N subunit